MIKILQKKFIKTAMAAISILLLVLLGTINIVNNWLTNQQTERTLTMLSENEGQLPPRPDSQPRERPGFWNPPLEENAAMTASYFVVFLDNNGNVVRTNVTRIASITEEEAQTLGQNVSKETAECGSIDRFQFQKKLSRDGRGSVIVFLDTSSQTYSILMVLGISISIGLLCWILMLLLVILLSKRAIQPIARNMEKQKQFVTNAGHEIKTPLAIILANTDAMELHNGENKWSRNIREQTLRLNGLMQNLLALAKMDERKEKQMPASDFSLSLLMKETLHSFFESAALKEIVVQANIQPDVILHANRESIAHLLSILFDNAVKYTNNGGQISVSLKKADKYIFIQVENTCAKLPEAEPERLFDRFYRGDSARTQKNGGYGIGLSVARAIVEACKGTILAAYDQEENKITFTVKL